MPRQQRGIVAVLAAVGLLAILAMVGLAFDTGHLVLNKSRLQSTVDASALAAAKVLDETFSEEQATAAARAVFDRNASEQGELGSVLSGADIIVQYSETLNPFVPGTIPANYVRVRANNFTMWTTFLALVGFDQLATGASAVAGPSAPIPEPCDLVPVTVCADMAAGAPNWGYRTDDVTLLKLASEASGSTLGPGNFQLIRLGGGGADIVRSVLAGGYQKCFNEKVIETQPGAQAGPVREGLNTRFGQYRGGMREADYPPDLITRTPNPTLTSDGTSVFAGGVKITPANMEARVTYTYQDYVVDMKNKNYTNPNGKPERRIVVVPIVDCRKAITGQSSVPLVDFGCFFLLQPVVQQGGGNEGYIYGQFVRQCRASGPPGPVGGQGVYTIVLHNDPDSNDS
jgi:hypothetical protein